MSNKMVSFLTWLRIGHVTSDGFLIFFFLSISIVGITFLYISVVNNNISYLR